MSLIVFVFLIIILSIFLIGISRNNKVFIFHREYLKRGVLCFVLGGLILCERGTYLSQEGTNYKNKWYFEWKGVLNWIDKVREKIRKKEKRKRK